MVLWIWCSYYVGNDEKYIQFLSQYWETKRFQYVLKNSEGNWKNQIFIIIILACDKPCLVCSSSKKGTVLGRFKVTTGFGYNLHWFSVDITGYLLICIMTSFSSLIFPVAISYVKQYVFLFLWDIVFFQQNLSSTWNGNVHDFVLLYLQNPPQCWTQSKFSIND